MTGPATDGKEGGGLSHLYGCEYIGCTDVGQDTRVWMSGRGYIIVTLCSRHAAPPPLQGRTNE